MMKKLFTNINNKDKSRALEGLIEHSTPSSDFFLLVVLSVLMATFGLLTDDTAVLIGSMLIAPLLYPILSLSMGIIMSDFSLVGRSFNTLLKTMILTVGTAAIITLFFTPNGAEYTHEILARTRPSLIVAAIGAVAGFAASFAMVKPKLSETLPGVAISVALIPPLAVVGIGLARLDVATVFSALSLFGANALGAIFTSMVVFLLMNFYVKRGLAQKVVHDEDAKLKEEDGA